MTPQELQELIAQQYGNVLTAGQKLTSQPNLFQLKQLFNLPLLSDKLQT